MKIELVWPTWCHLPWTEALPALLKDKHEVSVLATPTYTSDAIVYGWCDQVSSQFINRCPEEIRQIVFIRSYDYYQYVWQLVNWDKVDKTIFVNDVYAIEFNSFFKDKYKDKTRVIYNSVDITKWTFKQHTHGTNIAVVGLLNYKKNLPLALQIAAKVPKDCTLHFIGEPQEAPLYAYLCYLAKHLKVKAIMHGPLKQPELDRVLDDMNYLLCTSLVEGNPNNVNEAMAKGIKPIIHRWPGSVQQYGEDLLFTSVEQAAFQLSEQSDYRSEEYRKIVEERFSLKNLLEVVNEIEKCN